MKRRWLQAWDDLPQRSLQVWVEGIIANIKKVIELEGGNEYKEGRDSKRAYWGCGGLEAILNPTDDDEEKDVVWQDLEDEDEDGH